jgi:predicted glycosyltransferase
MTAQDSGRIPSNVKFLKSAMDLGELHASAAVVVSTGGYNSVLEAISGGARIIIHPSQGGNDDEQERFGQALSTYYPVRIVRELGALSGTIQEEFELFFKLGKARFELAKQGLNRILATISKDLENSRDLSDVG